MLTIYENLDRNQLKILTYVRMIWKEESKESAAIIHRIDNITGPRTVVLGKEVN